MNEATNEQREQIVQVVALMGKQGRGQRFSKELKAAAAEYCEARRAKGATFGELEKELGIKNQTLGRWCQHKRRQGRSKFRRVQIVNHKPTSSLRLFGPCGIRVDGLSIAQLSELLRRLC